MNSVVKFLIKLQADGGNVLSVSRRITNELNTIGRQAASVGAKLRQAFSFDSFKSSLMAVPGMELLTNPYVMIAGAVGAMTKLGASADMTRVSFETLVGSEEKAAKILADITKYADETPFDSLKLTENAQAMLNFGVSTESVMTYLKQLGDISGGNAERLSSLSLVFGQVSAAGKLSGQDLLQFINAGFNPLKELQAITGKSYQELQDMMSKGAITVDHVAAAMARATGEGGKFGGILAKQSQTLAGKWSTLVGTIQTKAVELYQQLKPGLMGIVDLVNYLIPPISAAFQMIFKIIGGAIGFVLKFKTELGLLAAVVGVGTIAFNAQKIALIAYTGVTKGVALVTKAWTGAQWLLNAAMNANPIGLLITGIAALIAAIVYCWNKFAGFRAFLLTMWDVMKGFGEIIKTFVIDRFKGMLSGLGKIGEALQKLFNGDFKGGWETAKAGVKELTGVDAASKAAQSLQKSWQSNWNKNLAAETISGAASKGPQGISTPGLTGSAALSLDGSGGSGKGGGGGSGKSRVGDAIATGGTRNSTINISIGKFFDSINVHMADKADTAEMEHVILDCINRSLAIAASSNR